MADDSALVVGDLWKYNKIPATHGETGDVYYITSLGLMKIGSGTKWVPSVTYLPYTAYTRGELKIFTRDVESFRQNFIRVSRPEGAINDPELKADDPVSVSPEPPNPLDDPVDP